MTDTIFTLKRKSFNILKQKYFQNSTNKAIWILKITNNENVDFLIDWLKVLPANFIICKENILVDENKTEIEQQINESKNFVFVNELNDEIISWSDFVILDNNEWSINNFMTNWVTPILPENNYLASLLKEFNPLENEWNAFLYLDNNNWSLYYAIVRYLENFKFPMDNRNLVKNVTSL